MQNPCQLFFPLKQAFSLKIFLFFVAFWKHEPKSVAEQNHPPGGLQKKISLKQIRSFFLICLKEILFFLHDLDFFYNFLTLIISRWLRPLNVSGQPDFLLYAPAVRLTKADPRFFPFPYVPNRSPVMP